MQLGNHRRPPVIDAPAYLASIGVPPLPPATYPFDPGYDAATVDSHLSQSSHLMAGLKMSMACWQIAAWPQSVRKAQAAARHGIPVITGGGPFEVAVARGRLERYLDLCAALGATCIEAGRGFTDNAVDPPSTVALAAERGLDVQFEVGKKHEGAFGRRQVEALVDEGRSWLEAGARHIVVEARESAEAVGLFDAEGHLQCDLADRFADTLGLGAVVFEAPDKRSQFALLDHFGREVQLSNVRLEELLRVEIYRRGLHSDSFDKAGLGRLTAEDGG